MQLYFILVAPARAANVGAAARAMKTMGFSAMRVVASKVHQEPEASWVAHGAQEILSQAEHFDELAQALSDMDLVIATTARARGRYQYYLTPSQVREQIRNKPSLGNVAVVFGCEESGLSNEQLAHADLISYLPLKVSYPSLNLGQAIMLYAYEMSQLLDEEGLAPVENNQRQGQVHALKVKTAEILDNIGVLQDEKLHQWVMDRVPMLAERDLNMLHLLCKDLLRELNKTV